MRRKHYSSGGTVVGLVALGIVGLTIAFWLVVGYVVAHFVLKFW